MYSLDQMPFGTGPFCRNVLEASHMKAFMAGNMGSGAKSLSYINLSQPWQPKPIHLQNGRCIMMYWTSIEHMVSLQNGYLFFGEGISFKTIKQYHQKPLQHVFFLSATKWLVAVPKNDHILNIQKWYSPLKPSTISIYFLQNGFANPIFQIAFS